MRDLLRADLEAELEPHFLEGYKFAEPGETSEKVTQLINLLKDVEALEDIWPVILVEGYQLKSRYKKEKNKPTPDESVLTTLQHQYNFIAKLDIVADTMLYGIIGDEGFGWQGEHKNLILYKINQIEKVIKREMVENDALLSDLKADEMLAGYTSERDEEEKEYYTTQLEYYKSQLKHLNNYKKFAKRTNKIYGRED